VRVRDRIPAADLADGRARLDRLVAAGPRHTELDGVWAENIWDLVSYLPALLASDIACIHSSGPSLQNAVRSVPAETVLPVRLRETAAVLGDHPVVVAADAIVDPHVVFDARGGPILVSSGATIHPFTRLEGPCFIGPGTTVLSGRIASCAIGEKCKISGELSNTTILAYSNKAHEGFVGHSIIGRWVNIGAGSITSNLKNTYGSVSLWTPHGSRDTGLQFLGTMFGDHSRTGIGTMLSTGSVLGAGANIFGGGMPPRYVPAFAWGVSEDGTFGEFDLEKFIEVAERAMNRRGVELNAGQRRHYAEVYRAFRPKR
jgi:UDP-N-acetylglucosamine diphosphorylase/glucosamine-1-phosphate N-acetyltransferase